MWMHANLRVEHNRSRTAPDIGAHTGFASGQDLESIDALEEYINRSQVIMIFVSKGYFLSKNCLREARTAVAKAKPLALVHDPVRGGATLETIKEDECPMELQGIFNGRKIIEWHRIKVTTPRPMPRRNRLPVALCDSVLAAHQ